MVSLINLSGIFFAITSHSGDLIVLQNTQLSHTSTLQFRRSFMPLSVVIHEIFVSHNLTLQVSDDILEIVTSQEFL